MDLYTKTVLTFIAITLAVIAFKPLAGAQATVNAQAPLPAAFSGMQFSGVADEFTLFDPKTGDIWQYNSKRYKPPIWLHSKILEFGKPVQESNAVTVGQQ
jgi:hypothetical protein